MQKEPKRMVRLQQTVQLAITYQKALLIGEGSKTSGLILKGRTHSLEFSLLKSTEYIRIQEGNQQNQFLKQKTRIRIFVQNYMRCLKMKRDEKDVKQQKRPINTSNDPVKLANPCKTIDDKFYHKNGPISNFICRMCGPSGYHTFCRELTKQYL